MADEQRAGTPPPQIQNPDLEYAVTELWWPSTIPEFINLWDDVFNSALDVIYTRDRECDHAKEALVDALTSVILVFIETVCIPHAKSGELDSEDVDVWQEFADHIEFDIVALHTYATYFPNVSLAKTSHDPGMTRIRSRSDNEMYIAQWNEARKFHDPPRMEEGMSEQLNNAFLDITPPRSKRRAYKDGGLLGTKGRLDSIIKNGRWAVANNIRGLPLRGPRPIKTVGDFYEYPDEYGAEAETISHNDAFNRVHDATLRWAMDALNMIKGVQLGSTGLVEYDLLGSEAGPAQAAESEGEEEEGTGKGKRTGRHFTGEEDDDEDGVASKMCGYCGERAQKRCGGCLKVSYCDQKCQAAHWCEHKCN